jgi:diguanylate cyclase (GGDEF)-like protein
MRRIGDQRRERAKRVAAEQNAYLASTRDPLTQLPNRRQFQIEVSTALKNSKNAMSVLLLGLNHFRKLNEVYGHLGCDEALSQIGSRIRDGANSGDVFARIGDDEFALCLAGMDPENALRVAGVARGRQKTGPNRNRTSQHQRQHRDCAGRPRPYDRR